jgi:hypothetical protein
MRRAQKLAAYIHMNISVPSRRSQAPTITNIEAPASSRACPLPGNDLWVGHGTLYCKSEQKTVSVKNIDANQEERTYKKRRYRKPVFPSVICRATRYHAYRSLGHPENHYQIPQHLRRGRENHSQSHQDWLDFVPFGPVYGFPVINVPMTRLGLR